jgi:putative PIN family toxin of toxin-antitoxin system
MMPAIPRAVLDTVVFVQALISGRGPSAGCLRRLKSGRFVLLLSDPLLREIREVPLRPELTRKYTQLTEERVHAFVGEIEFLAVHLPSTPTMFKLPRDPKDEPLIDLAIAGQADFLVTWNDRHLTYLMRRDTPEGEAFCAAFPKLQIVSPPDFLSQIEKPARKGGST